MNKPRVTERDIYDVLAGVRIKIVEFKSEKGNKSLYFEPLLMRYVLLGYAKSINAEIREIYYTEGHAIWEYNNFVFDRKI